MMRASCLLFIFIITLAFQQLQADPLPLYQTTTAPLDQRVDDLFNRLNPDEKLGLLGGTGFTTQPVPRLGIPAMAMVDAGQGVRGGQDGSLGPATAFPAGVLMASSWDTNLISRIGRAIGVEARNKGPGASIVLGPAVNIHRTPLGGRNAEYFSEDPYLAARMAVSYIEGMQSGGVSSCVKHYACNNQEQDRDEVNATVSERALREIYLPAFEAAVKDAKVGAVMSSYNQVNGLHSSANPYLLIDVLKKAWGFDGVVMSDWGGVHETAAVQAGNDLEMPTGDHMSIPKLKKALADGSVTQEAVDDSVHRILRTIIRVGLLDHPAPPDEKLVNSPEHRDLAYEAATKGIVLLKNAGSLLPLNPKRLKSIAVIGAPAKKLQIGALGSPAVPPLHRTELLDAIQSQVGTDVAIHYVAGGTYGEPLPASVLTPPDGMGQHGYRAEYYTNRDLSGTPALVRVENEIHIRQADTPGLPAPGIPSSDFSVRWSAKLNVPASGNYQFAFTGDDGFRVYLDGKLLIDRWVKQSQTTVSGQADLEAGRDYDLRIEYFQAGGDFVAQFAWQPPQTAPFADAVAAAQSADVAVVCVSTRETDGEGNDRPSLSLPDNQSGLIQAVAAANPRTIVILNTGTPVLMNDWLGDIAGLIEAWYPGQEGGAALADVLFGKVDPSGKLPDTFGAKREDYPDFGNYPGENKQVNYAEGIYIGYRHFDKDRIEPVFPFGFGLSYTTFKYNKIKLSKAVLQPDETVTASLTIKNTGKREGEEVVELYIRDTDPKIDRPVRELKGFCKVKLLPGKKQKVEFAITPRNLSYFDAPGHQWKAGQGNYEIEIGASSRDLRQMAVVQLKSDYTEPVPFSREDARR